MTHVFDSFSDHCSPSSQRASFVDYGTRRDPRELVKFGDAPNRKYLQTTVLT